MNPLQNMRPYPTAETKAGTILVLGFNESKNMRVYDVFRGTDGENLAQVISCDTLPVVENDNFGQLASGKLVLEFSYYTKVSSCNMYQLEDENSDLKY
jgi:hypothetical protein